MNRVHNPTGVGKHVINMTRLLAAAQGVDLRILTSSQYLSSGMLPADNPLRGIPLTAIPLSQKILDLAWLTLGRPLVDRWAGGADWIYCPAEVPVPSKRSRLAVTGHCLLWMETGAPWSRGLGMRRDRAKWSHRMAQIRRRADVVFVVSEFLKTRTTALTGIPPEKIFVVGNGVEPVYYEFANTPREHAGTPYALVIGGLCPLKGADVILAAARLLRERRAGVEIWVAGRGQAEVDRVAKAIPGIRLLGYQGLDQLPRLLRDAACLLFPSQHETFGIPAAEAMAIGTPPVVSARGALPEVVGDGGVVLSPSADPGEAVEAVTRLASDTAYRDEVAERGRRRAKAFTWQVCAQRVLDRLMA
jgi:glycosyltransferase involved in cell wall biosynthesis